MAEEHHKHDVITTPVEAVETQDRGVFDFLGKKDDDKITPPAQVDAGEEVLVAEFEKVEVSEPKVEKEDEIKERGLLEKLHDSSSSSSDEDEEEGSEKKKKKKKGLLGKITGEEEEKKPSEDTNIPIEKYEETEEKKGFLEKLKEKLPGHKKTEEVTSAPAPAPAPAEVHVEETKEKKGILEKIKEKLPGYHPKAEDEKPHGSD